MPFYLDNDYVRCSNDDFCYEKLNAKSICAKFINNPGDGFINFD